jgi:molybdopterin-guanine dinucleotide biosynthesis protein A
MTEAKTGWTAIILAGQRPGIDPLADAFGETFKALVQVGGRPMVAHVVETILSVPGISKVVILCQQPEVIKAVLPDHPALTYVESQSGISQSILGVAGTEAAPWPLFVTTADHPLLTHDMIAHFLEASADADVAVGMVERATILAAYPDNQRTWIKLRGGAWSGANLFALSGEAARRALTLWVSAEKDRKQLFKLFWHFGLLIALRAITRTISLENGIAALGRRLGLNARAVPLPFAEAAIDVDKTSDHRLVEQILAVRVGKVS